MAPHPSNVGSLPSDGHPRSVSAPTKGHQACERCWKRKQKCDRLLPSCSTCSSLGIACQARNVQFDLLTDDSPLSHASTQSYVNTLKRKVEELQQSRQNSESPQKKRARLVGSSKEERDHGHPAPFGSARGDHHVHRTAASEAGTSSTRGASTSAARLSGLSEMSRSRPGSVSASISASGATPTDTTDDSIRAMMGEIGILSRSALGEPREDEPSAAVSNQRALRLALDRVVLAALSLDGHDPSRSPSCSGSTAAAGIGPGDMMRPPPSMGAPGAAVAAELMSPMASSLSSMAPPDDPLLLTRHASAVHLRHFLDEVAVRYPHLAGAAAADQLEAQYEAVSTSLSSSPPAFRFYVYLAVATGALLAPDAARLRSFSQRLHAAAVRMLPAVLHQQRTASTNMSNGNGSSISNTGGEALGSIRAILGLVIYATLSPDGGSAWHLLGIATKRCITLGLRREPDLQASLTPAEVDERRRLFWSVYLLDRTIGLVMDRPFSIHDDDISVNMPEDDGSKDALSSFSLSHHLVVLARLVSAVRTNARTAPLFDYSNFCYWRDFLPPLSHLPTDAREGQTDHLHLLGCRTLIQITANWLNGQPRKTRDQQPTGSSTSAANSPSTPASSPALLSGQSLIQSIEDDTAKHCRGVIERAYARADREMFVGTFVDAYDLFAAGVVYLCLTSRRQDRQDRLDRQGQYYRDGGDPQSLLETTDLLNKCTMLITSIGERFSALKPLRRVLISLVSRLRARQMAHNIVPLETVPAIVPSYLKKMISTWL